MRRSLSESGGPTLTRGDAATAAALAHCLRVSPEAELPLTHGFHAYPARMHPEIARRALATFAGRPGVRVLDPFVGSGTTAVETVRIGGAFTGSDISRVALEIAWARTRVFVPEESRRVEREAERVARLAFHQSDRAVPLPEWARAQSSWYAPHTLHEISLLKTAIDAVSGAGLRRILTCILSSLMVKLSAQESDSVPVPARRPRVWPRRAAFRLFTEKASELTRAYLRLGSDLHKRGIKAPEPQFLLADARTLRLAESSFDLVLSSPPYPGVYDYVGHHGRRFGLFGDDEDFARAHEIGSRRDLLEKQGGFDRYRADLRSVLMNLSRALVPEGRVLLLIGDGVVGGVDLRTDRLLEDIAPDAGLRFEAVASQERREWVHVRRGSRKYEHLAALRKPAPAH